jgi:type IV secretory pathway TraG/TraD family ATPase VirD4
MFEDDNSTAAPQDLAVMGTLAALAAVVLTAVSGLVFTVTVAEFLVTGSADVPGFSGWGAQAWRVLTHPSDPGAALPVPWSALAGHPGLVWTVAAAVFLGGAVVVVGVGLWLWRWCGPVRQGHASRRAIRAELSVQAARRKAAITRPGMTPAQRRHAPLVEVGAPMHRCQIGELCVPFENPTGTLAPTQSGKSRRDLVHKVIGAPAALLCSTTKPDLLEFAGLARTRRDHAGPVMVFDTTGAVCWPAKVRWSPIHGCEHPSVAVRRAAVMVEAAAVGLRGVSGNDKVFRDRAKVVLSTYLLAAAVHGRSTETLVNWAMTRADEPAALLERDPLYSAMATNLRRESAMVAETSDAVWMSVRRVIEPLLDPLLLELCSPPPGESFEARAFITQHGSLFLIAGENQAGAATPILTALAEYWIETAREMALQAPNRRLDPPATAVLDELTNATPLPELPAKVSDSAGRGVAVHWAAQSRAGLEEAYGPNGASLLIENTTLVSIWGGGKDQRTLEWVSALCGHHERRRYQTQSDGLMSPGRTAIGTETVPVYRPGDIRKLPRNEVLIIHRSLGAIRAKTSDVSQRPDWPHLRRDVESVRAGTLAVDTSGYATRSVSDRAGEAGITGGNAPTGPIRVPRLR